MDGNTEPAAPNHTAGAVRADDYALERSPSHLLHRAQQFAADRFAEAIEDENITQRQFAVLSAVAANEGLTQTDLVRATGIDRSTLAELVARMVRRALLVRERAPNDGRANTVRLADEGRALLARTTPRVAVADEAILEALAKNKRAGFLDTLQRIADTLDAPPVQPASDVAGAPSGKADKKPKAAKPKKIKAKAKDEKPKAAKVKDDKQKKPKRSKKKASA